MRKISKYKYFFLCKKDIFSYPLKLNQFKHSKWSFIKNALKKIKKKNFTNFFKLSKKLKFLIKKKKIFKTNLIYTKNIKLLLDNSIKLRKIKKSINLEKDLNFRNIFKKILIKSEYRIDVLLYRLKIFNNIFDARKYISTKGVLINNELIYFNKTLKKGDLLNFEKLLYSLKKNIKVNVESPYILPFIEVDFYTSQLIIIKNLSELSEEDLLLFFKYFCNISQLYNLIFKK